VLDMSELFRPFRIGTMEIRNRFMRSATTSAWSDERGVVRDEIIDLYGRLAEGGVGLIVKGHLYVADTGKAHRGMAGISGDYHVPRLRELTEAVHEREGKIVAQLNYAGLNSMVDRAGPSEYVGEGWRGRALGVDEIGEIVDAFGDAADRAMEAGFDGVQIHGAHGYLISQFLSRLTNRRTDEYGGSLKRRMRLLEEVYDEVRSSVGGCVPVMLKMNCDDFTPGGFTVEDSVKVARAICERGIDSIEVSGGGLGRRKELRSRARSEAPVLAEASFAGHAAKIREATRPRPLALVDGIRSLNCMKAIVEGGLADLISMSRPFIREPDLVLNLRAGQEAATCITCDSCRQFFGSEMMRCALE
jgi:2,4-dienoyl-CoA reductase-like NADH-dependent reductase (Old Yellow Enzyme family)